MGLTWKVNVADPKLSHSIIQYRKPPDYNKISDLIENIIKMEQYCDINMKVHHFSKVLIDALDSNACLITKRAKYQSQPPWFNYTILKGIHKRELAKRKKDYNDYKLWRNMVVEQIR